MDISEIEKIFEKINQIEKIFGIGGAVIILILGVSLFLSWKFLTRSAEIIAEETSEKTLKKFQTQLDKEFVKFQIKHQKQIDAIHETFQVIERMIGLINFLIHGEKFSSPPKGKEELKLLIEVRRHFLSIYNPNRLLFSRELCTKIDKLIPAVENFIETYDGGLMDMNEEQIDQEAEENGGLYIAGIWSLNAFDKTLEELKSVSQEIETEFRKIYGTDE